MSNFRGYLKIYMCTKTLLHAMISCGYNAISTTAGGISKQCAAVLYVA